MLDKAKDKYGTLDSDSEEDEEEEEDEEAALINPKFERKFIETLTMIRSNDPKIKGLQGELFNDEDFEAGD